MTLFKRLLTLGIFVWWISGSLYMRLDAPSTARAADRATSQLWGAAGENWDPKGRLPDYSYAGYHCGENPLPRRPVDVSVRDFGATGDGIADDTAAIQRAVRESPGEVISLPAGRYLINDIVEIAESGTVLRGAGIDETVIFAPTPLEKIRPNMGATTSDRPTSRYSWSGGIIWAKGKWNGRKLAKVTEAARRGENTLVVDRTDRFQLGDAVRLVLSDDSNRGLTHHLYAGDPGDFSNLKPVKSDWLARVRNVNTAERRITLDRPLRTDVRKEWKPVLHQARSTIEEIGVEDLSFEFPVTPYRGHFTELGYNAIAFGNVRNGWIRNVEFRHADSGIFVSGANNTITQVVWKSDRDRDDSRNSTGHHGVTLGGTDQLLTEFDFQTKFIHDITVTRGSAGNVARAGRAEDLTIDHHKCANHANLFTNIDAGVGTDIFRSGGGAKLGRHCGAWTTWWNVRAINPMRLPNGWATERINMVGVSTTDASSTEPDGRWLEVIAPSELRPNDLYEAQRKRRIEQSP